MGIHWAISYLFWVSPFVSIPKSKFLYFDCKDKISFSKAESKMKYTHIVQGDKNLVSNTNGVESESNVKIKYEDIIAIENLEEGLKRTKHNVASGLDGETKADFSRKKIEDLHQKLKKQSYKPRAVKRINIPKPDGGTRPLGIAGQIDKVVQAAILIKLEPVLEKVFHEFSYGFRPKRGCHDAMKRMKKHWQGGVWIINVDISKCFDKVHHNLLLELVSKYVDQPTVELIRKLIKVGYVDIHNLNDRMEYCVEGTPQGSLISPILCNLILHELDKKLDSLCQENTRGESRANNEAFRKRHNLDEDDRKILEKYPELRQSLRKVKHRRWVLDGKSSQDSDDPGFRRLHFVRYADDFILCFVGPKAEALDIKRKVEEFLAEIHFSTNEKKSKIYHSSDKGIKYLGFYIRWIQNNKIIKKKVRSGDDQLDSGIELKAIAINSMQIRVPVDRILKRLADRGYAKVRKDGSVRATSCRRLGSFEDRDIVRRFSSIIRGICNYYSCVNQRSDLWSIVALLRKSAALTLADKHKLKTAAKVFRRYGPKLKIQPAKLGGKVTELYYPTTLKTKISFRTGENSDLVQANPMFWELELSREVIATTRNNE